MEQTTAIPQVVRCERCNGRVIQGEEPYCFQCGNRPNGFVHTANDYADANYSGRRKPRHECLRGHEMTSENTIIRGGFRRCRKCANEINRLSRLRVLGRASA